MKRKIIRMKVDERFKQIMEQKSDEIGIPVTSMTTILAFQLKDDMKMFQLRQRKIGRKKRLDVEDPGGFSFFR